MEDADLCFITNPLHPTVMSEAAIYSDVETYHTYLTEKELEEKSRINEDVDDKLIVLETKAQVKQFVNAVFKPATEINVANDHFTTQELSTDSIFKFINMYTNEFKTSISFATWCSAVSTDFLLAECSRKSTKITIEERKRTRFLSVLKKKFHAQVANDIASVLVKHQKKILDMKKSGYIIVGYVRKSKQLRRSKKHVELLQEMINNLYERSLVDYVFVSPMENANTPFSSRDLECDMEILHQLENIHGNIKDLLHFITIHTHKICLESCDFAGLTTNHIDLQAILIHNPNIKKVAIDLFYYENRFDVLDRNDLLKDTNLLNLFNESRAPFKQRHLRIDFYTYKFFKIYVIRLDYFNYKLKNYA